MAIAADRAGIHFRTLNARKGPAVRATRAQADRTLYRKRDPADAGDPARAELFQQAVDDLSVVRRSRHRCASPRMGLEFSAPCVVLTVGTFLAGRIHVGESQQEGGRAGDPPALRLAQRLRELPLRVGRLKTGTPPRIDGRSIDFSRLEIQPGDEPRPVFSFMGRHADHPRQVPCHITATNERTHEIIRGALHRSPMFSGAIEGTGPRYCPSVEDKIQRFADKNSHQIFVEPEGLDTPEVYPNGISTSLPFDVQHEFVRSIRGFEHAHITRPGYAIEYDFFDPRDLQHTLESRFFAGLVPGRTDQRHHRIRGGRRTRHPGRHQCGAPGTGARPWYPRRHEAYIGVLVDDLITRGTAEPYRMFTSRAEHRLLLREDNADLRLTPTGRELGLVDDARWHAFECKRVALEDELSRLTCLTLQPGDVPAETAARLFGGPLMREYRAADLLKRPEIRYADLAAIDAFQAPALEQSVSAQVEIQLKYDGYIRRQQAEIERQQIHQERVLPPTLDYAGVAGLSHEVRQKLEQQRPATLGQAARIPGVTPAAISLLLIHLKRQDAPRIAAAGTTSI